MKNEGVVVQACWKQQGVWGDKTCVELEHCQHCRNCDTYARAGRRLLDRKVSATERQRWTKQLAQPYSRFLSDCQAMLVFRLASEWFAMNAVCFDEILEIRPVHSVPHHNDVLLRGLINIHGELQLCVALHHLLGVAPGNASEIDNKCVPRILSMSLDGESLAFQADEVACVHACHADELEHPPATLSQAQQVWVRGMFRWQDHHVTVLDAHALFATMLERIG